MRKCLVILLVAVLMLTTTAFALAPATPSMTVEDIASTVVMDAVDGTSLPDGFEVFPTEYEQRVLDVIEMIKGELEADAAIVHHFGEEIQNQIAEKLPEDVSAEALEVNEIINIDAVNYDESIGDVVVTMKFITSYTLDQDLVALVGTFAAKETPEDKPADADCTWFVLDAEALEDGTVAITFTKEAILAIEEAATSMLFILNTPA